MKFWRDGICNQTFDNFRDRPICGLLKVILEAWSEANLCGNIIDLYITFLSIDRSDPYRPIISRLPSAWDCGIRNEDAAWTRI